MKNLLPQRFDFRRMLPRAAMVLFVLQLLLMLVSWLCSAAFPTAAVRSLLSGEGLRWLMGRFADMMATPLLVWIVLLSMAWGCLTESRLLVYGRTYRQSRARLMAVLLLVVIVVVMLLLTVIPHAVLLSASGSLWPSPFSQSLVPVAALTVIVCSAVYGLVAGTFQGVADVYRSLLSGLRAAAPWLLFYILLSQLYHSIIFILYQT
jgi:aminobenzoyl-glutamate transport protein